MNFIFEWQNSVLPTNSIFCHEKIKFISLSRRVIRQKDINKIIDFYSPMQKVIVTAQIYSTAI